jgi:uncharacterized SAM-binding protein YcdF (DUF218 family)
MRTLALSKRQRRFAVISVCLVLLISGGYAARRPLLASPAVYLRIEDPLRPADLIAVMPSEWQGVEYGIELYKKGYAPRLMLIGGYPFELIAQDGESFRVVKMDWEQVARGIALQAGVPDDAIVTRGGSSTYEQARQFVDLAEASNLKTVIIVTDDVHPRRISWSVSKFPSSAQLALIYSPVPRSIYLPQEQFETDQWWTDEERTKQVFAEYVKLGYYLAFGSR